MRERAAAEHRAAVTEEVAAHCLDGMARAAAALVGNEVGRVCATFDGWLGEARRTWPWLPGLCFDALAPIGVRFPAADERAIVLGRLLVAAETDAEAVRWALGDLDRPAPGAAGAGSASRADRAPLPPDAAGALRARRLVAAVDGFWAELTRGAAAAHEPVVLGDRASADRVMSRTRRLLEDLAEEVSWLAGAVAQAHSTAPPSDAPPSLPPASPIPPVSPVPPPPNVRPARSSPSGPRGSAPRRDRGATASARTGRPPRPPSSAGRPAGASPASGRGPRDRTWEPIAFLALAVIAAVAVLWRVGGL